MKPHNLLLAHVPLYESNAPHEHTNIIQLLVLSIVLLTF